LNPINVFGSDEDTITIDEVANYAWIEQDVILATSDYEQIFLDGIEVSNGYILNIIGSHVIEFYTGGEVVETKRITITPRFDVMLDDQVFNDDVSFTLENQGELYLNDELVESNVSLDLIGNHEVLVKGINSFEKEYEFTLNDSYLEFLDGQTYHFDIVVPIDGFENIYLNDHKMTNNFRLQQLGKFEIRVTGPNRYSETYSFTRAPNTFYIEDNKTFQDVINVNVSGALEVYLDGVIKKNDFTVKEIGNHTLVFTGHNGYRETYNVTLEEPFVEEMTELEMFNYKFTGYEVFFNDKKYASEDEIFEVGYHDIKIKGANDYENNHRIFIYQEIELPNDETIKESFTLNTNYKKEFVNGKLVKNFRFKDSGDYQIDLEGEGGYTESFNFTYENPNEDIARNILTITIILGVLTLTTVSVAVVRGLKK